MNTEEERNRILSNLRNLKGIPEYKIISLTEDYTITGRQMTKDWSDKAKEKIRMNQLILWRVRGSPKNGLRLKRFLKPTRAIKKYSKKVKKYSNSYNITKKQITIKIIRNHVTGTV